MKTSPGPGQAKNARGFRHNRPIILMVPLLILSFAASIFASITLFSRATREYREQIMINAARLAAAQIDANKIDHWLESGPDDDYVRTNQILRDICNHTPYIQYLYVYQMRPDGCHTVFDHETATDDLLQYSAADIPTNSIGEVVDFDESFADYIPALLAGERIDIIESNDTFGWLLTQYEPIYDDSGKCTAYVGVDISMVGVMDYNAAFMKWIVGISLVFISAIVVIGLVLFFQDRRYREFLESERRRKQQSILFAQTAEALASAIDAKDSYTVGHSRRVAEYTRRIAAEVGKSPENCEDIYFSALLHDVGKIGISNDILSKKGRLTDAEFAQIKQHPVIGGNILSSIRELPWLSIGARYHHERYNGKGYPDGLKGDDIPEIARMIAVADAYDAMTSNRSYRSAIPQHIVREELVRGTGTQFDPQYARIMIRMIDQDPEYRMREDEHKNRPTAGSVRCDEIYHDCTTGFLISKQFTTIHLCSRPDEKVPREQSLPTLILFDALDGRVHPGEEANRDLLYLEYARVRLDGRIEEKNTRKVRVWTDPQHTDLVQADLSEPEMGQRYKIVAFRFRDHARLQISDETRTIHVTLALPDASRFLYISISGEHCEVHSILVENDPGEAGPDSIQRIADEISYIKGLPEGDVPNVQVDSWRSLSTEGIPVDTGMNLTFHAMSLPTARLVSHCPYIFLYTSDDGKVMGQNYREYMLMRLDGESWDSDPMSKTELTVTRTEAFTDWNAWRTGNRKGLDCTVRIRREDGTIVMDTENLGILLHSVTTLSGDAGPLYAALTGDQVALSMIRAARNP